MSVTLYKKDSKGRIRIWKGLVIDDEVVTYTGLVDGKLKEERRKATPKNVGKANETTGHEQALLELESKVKKERDKGYFDSIGDAENEVVVLPMLAHPYNKRKKHVKWPCLVQPKLDGVRAMVLVDFKTGLFNPPVSRKGKPFASMSSLATDLAELVESCQGTLPTIPDKVWLDGELFSDQMTFEDLVGVCRRSFESHEKKGTTYLLDLVRFNVFDCYVPDDPDMGFESRMDIINASMDVGSFSMMEVVPTYAANNESEVFALHAKLIEEGHEGSIIRNVDGVYKLNGRSNDLLKYKDFVDDEFELVGFEEGQGRDQGTVIWVCDTGRGEFKCRPRGTYEQRKEWFENGAEYVGKLLTVRYQNLTQDGIPRFPVGIAIRDYE